MLRVACVRAGKGDRLNFVKRFSRQFVAIVAISLTACSSAREKGALSTFTSKPKDLRRKIATSDAQIARAGVPLTDNKVFTKPAEILANLDQTESTLYATSGFTDRTEILAAAKSSGGTLAQAADLLMQEKIEVAIALTSDRRGDVVKSGFMNFRQVPAQNRDNGGTVWGQRSSRGQLYWFNTFGLFKDARGFEAKIRLSASASWLATESANQNFGFMGTTTTYSSSITFGIE